MKQLLYILLLLPVIGNAQFGKKISELPKVDALTSADLVPVVQNGKNYSATVSKFANASVPDTVSGTHLFTGVVQLDSVQLTGNSSVLRPVSVSKDSVTGALGRGCASDCYWLLGGNGGTTAGTNFIGTTDSADLVVKTNNSEALRVYANKAILNAINSTTQFFTYRPFPFQPTRIGFGYTYIKAGFDSLSVLFVDETGLIYAVGNAATGYTSSFKCDKDEINTSMVNGNHVFGYECRRSVPHVEQYISYTTGNYNIAEATLKRNGISIMVDGESRHQKQQLWLDTLNGIGYYYNDSLKFQMDSAGLKIRTGNPGTGKVLTSDAYGNATWGNQILTGSATLDFGTIAPNSHETLTITVTGAALGDVVSLGIPNASTNDHGAFMAWVSATDTVSVKCFNFDGVGFNPASGTFTAKIFK